MAGQASHRLTILVCQDRCGQGLKWPQQSAVQHQKSIGYTQPTAPSLKQTSRF